MSNEQYSERVQKAIAFIEKLKIGIGEDAGKNLILRPWQKAFINDVIGPTKEDGKRKVLRAIFSCPRKQGKTELAAACILLFLIGPEAELNGEIYSAANDRDQAAIVFNACVRFIEASPTLQKYLTIVESRKTIFVSRTDTKAKGSKFKALSSDAKTKHGLNPSFVVVDELAQAKSRELFDTLATSQGGRSQPLLMVISTQSDDPNHVLSQMIDDGLKGEDPTTVCHLHTAPDGCDVLDESAWFEANPALGDFINLDTFRSQAQRAARMPAEEQAFRLLHLNQRVSLTATLITRSDWFNCLPDGNPLPPTVVEADSEQFEVGEEIYAGLDMSLRTDLTALVCYSPRSGLVKTYTFKPKELLKEHGKRDQQTYALWTKQGWMTATSGRSIGPEFVAAKIAEVHARNPIKGLAFDRAYTKELLNQLDMQGILAQEGDGAGLRIVEWGQGFISMGKAVNAFEHLVLQNQLRSDGNPTLTMAVLNAVTDMDPAGNRKFMKNKSTMRIDPAVALAMAVGLAAEDRSKTSTKKIISAFEDEDFDLELY